MVVGYIQPDYWAEGYWYEVYWVDYGLGVPALDVADYKTESWTVSKGIEDALWVLSAKIDKHDVPAFFEMIEVTATDHNNITHTPFVGILPATDYALAASANKSSLTGYDYGWYLTVQYVPTDDRTTEEDTDPSDTITMLLGGTAWATTTGIEPYRINNVTDWTNIKKAFEFTDRCTRWKAIQEICDYCNFIFVVKWRHVGGTWRPCAYFVHEDDIDSSTAGLDIPTAVTITEPDAYLLDGVSVKDSPEHQYNRVLATGYDAATTTYFYATAQTAEVSATPPTAIPIEYVHADAALNTQAKTQAKAQELLDFFQASAKVYVARFKRRMDLELYQKISFSGYNKIDTDEMRITYISYLRSAANDMVEITFSKDQAIQQLRRLARAVNPDHVSGMQDMIGIDLSDIGLIDVFDEPLTGEGGGLPPTTPLWEISEGYARLADAKPIDMRGMEIMKVMDIRGYLGYDFSLWGSNSAGTDWAEFLRWNRGSSETGPDQFIEILEDLYINNDSQFPKIYFDVDPFTPTYIRGIKTTFNGLGITVDGVDMLNFVSSDYTHFLRDVKISPDLVIGGAIKGWDNNDLEFKVAGTGKIKFTKV